MLALLAVLALLTTSLALVVAPPGGPPPAAAATRVAKDECRRVDPNLVNGVCLRYETPQGSGLTWIGTYRAPDGRVFFCIDFLYDPRLPRRAERVPTDRLVNQLGDRVGDAEVAALNYVVSTWAGRGSTGSDDRDAAIALLVREVMGDGRRPGGLVVYPAGLRVGGVVRPPVGGLDRRVMRLARSMWREASARRGPWRLSVDLVGDGPVRVGEVRSYRARLVSAAGRPVPGVRVRVDCDGPVACPRTTTTTPAGAAVRVRATDVGRFRLRVRASGPAPDGVLYRQRGWSTHGGSTARPAGVQRGWIAQSTRARAEVVETSRVRVAFPTVRTVTSAGVVTPGTPIHDVVTVTGLAPGYDATVVGELHGPFAAAPDASSCTPATLAGRVTWRLRGDGTSSTPTVTPAAVGWYTWVQRLPGNTDTTAVTTPCGLPEETTRVVPRTPSIATTVSEQRSLVGRSLHDVVRIIGLAPSDRTTLTWRLHGPLAPRSGTSCVGLGWSRAAVAASGTMPVTGSGTVRTPAVRVGAPGCYTYSQSLAATPTTTAASSPPGLVAETSLVTRPVTPVVPEVPTGLVGRTVADRALPAPGTVATTDPSPFVPARRSVPRFLDSDYRAAAPARRASGSLVVPRVGVRVGIAEVGLDRGAVAVPRRRDLAGWLRTTATPDDLLGSAVISGHTSAQPGELGALERVRRGDVVRWSLGARAASYTVTAVRRVPRSRGLPASLFRTDGPAVVHLVTCAGLVRDRQGRARYVDNLVVTAVRR